MIRINLLGQARPKAAKQAVPLEATVQILLFGAAVVVAAVVLFFVYVSQSKQLDQTRSRIRDLQAEKGSLQQIKAEVDKFESQKAVLQQRIDVIETLQKNRTGAQDLLQNVANTVGRVDALWLISVTKTGDSLAIEGEAGSINAVANFITELKRSGYFTNVEIKQAKENDIRPSVETYQFSMTVSISPPSTGAAAAQTTGATQSPSPAPKGRS
ncbi:MAG TPA: PilN domain-containing protein [Candidatus Aquilonibacter sp.]|nr:PilN domain-containing protein [Candidatus Aquilonibacter sp.]